MVIGFNRKNDEKEYTMVLLKTRIKEVKDAIKKLEVALDKTEEIFNKEER